MEKLLCAFKVKVNSSSKTRLDIILFIGLKNKPKDLAATS
jgi:hypothetical protein